MSETALKEKNGEHPFGDAGQLILFLVFLAVWTADSFILRRSTALARHIPLPVRLLLLGLALLTTALLFRSGVANIHHGRRTDHVLTTGAFRFVRHPLYLGVLLVYLGLVLATGSLLSLAVFVMIFLFYDHIAGYEEKLLNVRFGAAYKEYRARTGKWVPRLLRPMGRR